MTATARRRSRPDEALSWFGTAGPCPRCAAATCERWSPAGRNTSSAWKFRATAASSPPQSPSR